MPKYNFIFHTNKSKKELHKAMLKGKHLLFLIKVHNRIINKMNIEIKDRKNKEFEDKYIVIAINSTAINGTNRDQWIKEINGI